MSIHFEVTNSQIPGVKLFTLVVFEWIVWIVVSGFPRLDTLLVGKVYLLKPS